MTYPFIIKELSCLRVWNFGLRSFGSLVEHDCLIFRSSICSAAYGGSYAGSNASKYKQPRHTGNVRSISNKSSYEKGPDSKSGPKRSPNPDSVTQAILLPGCNGQNVLFRNNRPGGVSLEF